MQQTTCFKKRCATAVFQDCLPVALPAEVFVEMLEEHITAVASRRSYVQQQQQQQQLLKTQRTHTHTLKMSAPRRSASEMRGPLWYCISQEH